MTVGSHSAAPSIHRNTQYGPRELQPFGLIAGTSLYFTVRSALPVRTFAEFAALARTAPGGLSNGHAGVGSASHLACALDGHIAGLRLNPIPYWGEAPAVDDVVAGRIDHRLRARPRGGAAAPGRHGARADGRGARAFPALAPDRPVRPRSGPAPPPPPRPSLR